MVGVETPAALPSAPIVNTRTSGVYLRAAPEDMSCMDGRDDRQRKELIARRLEDWKSISLG